MTKTPNFQWQAMVCVLTLCTFSNAALAASAAVKCQATKNKLAGNYYACREKAEAKAITTGSAADYTKCSAKFEAKFAAAETNGGGLCPDDASASALNTYIGAQQQSVAAILAGGSVPICGDDAINRGGEQCDGTDLSGATCETLGFPGGTLACSGCKFDTSACDPDTNCPICGSCGGGAADKGEECDGADLRSKTCQTEGFTYGALKCTAGCLIDTSDCKNAGTRFADNADGTISDTETGLQWEKQVALDGSVDTMNLHDADNPYPWAGRCSVATTKTCQPTAAAAAACLAGAKGSSESCAACSGGDGVCDETDTVWTWLLDLNAASFAGHDDWRLPRMMELVSIVDYPDAVILYDAFNGTNCGAVCTDMTDASCSCTATTNSPHYWSRDGDLYADEDGQPSPSAWSVIFNTSPPNPGSVANGNVTRSSRVRAVRGGS